MAVDESQTAQEFADAVDALGLPVTTQPDSGQRGQVQVVVDNGGRPVLVTLRRASAATPGFVGRLPSYGDQSEPADGLHVLVADRIPEAARRDLASRGWGWLDLRGHLHLRGQGLFIDAAVPAAGDRAGRASPLSGAVGLEVASALLLVPDIRRGVRDLARELGRSASTVSEILTTLRDQGLVGADGLPRLPDLFWELAAAWTPQAVLLAQAPGAAEGAARAALHLGFDDIRSQTGWALTGTLAAAVYGAPVAARADYPPDFYVPSQAVLQRATRLLGTPADAGSRLAAAQAAPVGVICRDRVDPAALSTQLTGSHSWPLAHPLFVALDLARDPGRGREVLEGWQPPAPWRKVW